MDIPHTVPEITELEGEGTVMEIEGEGTEVHEAKRDKKGEEGPKGSKNKVMMDKATGKVDNGRGQALNPHNALHVAKAWVEQSCKGSNQPETAMYEAVAKI